MIAGKGERLFEQVDLQPLRLVSSAAFPTGVVHLHYAKADFPNANQYEHIVDKAPTGE